MRISDWSSDVCSSDHPIVVRQNWLDAYDYTTDKGAAVLNDYASKNDPFARVGRESVTVQITSVTRASDASFNVRWTEQRFVNGAPTGTERWNAVVSIVLQTPRTEQRLRKNPLGIYVNGLRSEEHTSELQSLMRISYAVFCLKKTKQTNKHKK